MNLFDVALDYSGWIVGVVAGVGALGYVMRVVSKKVSHLAEKFDNVADALLGREEIRHPDTNKILAPATPGLGTRLARIEEALERLVETDTRITHLETKVDEHIAEATEQEKARMKETQEMWAAIRAIAHTTPDYGGAM